VKQKGEEVYGDGATLFPVEMRLRSVKGTLRLAPEGKIGDKGAFPLICHR